MLLMFTTTQHAAHIEVSIVLQSGTTVGTGFAQSPQTARYFACIDAVDADFCEAACGHSRFLSEREENSVRAAAALKGYR